MPPLVAALPVIAAVAGLAGTGVGLGLELSNQPGGATTPPPTPAVINQEQQQEKAAISQQAPNILAQTSGLANPDYVAQLAQLLAGTGGQTGSQGAASQIASQLFGLSPGTPATPGAGSSFTPAGTGTANNPAPANSQVQLSDFVNRFIFGGA